MWNPAGTIAGLIFLIFIPNSQEVQDTTDKQGTTKDVKQTAVPPHNNPIADYTEAIRLNPKDSYAFGKRRDCYRMKGDYERAIAECNEAIHLDPK